MAMANRVVTWSMTSHWPWTVKIMSAIRIGPSRLSRKQQKNYYLIVCSAVRQCGRLTYRQLGFLLFLRVQRSFLLDTAASHTYNIHWNASIARLRSSRNSITRTSSNWSKFSMIQTKIISTWVSLRDAVSVHCCRMGTAIRHPVPE